MEPHTVSIHQNKEFYCQQCNISHSIVDTEEGPVLIRSHQIKGRSPEEMSDREAFHLFEIALREGNFVSLQLLHQVLPEKEYQVTTFRTLNSQTLLHLMSTTGEFLK